jgi:hypothetical protein
MRRSIPIFISLSAFVIFLFPMAGLAVGYNISVPLPQGNKYDYFAVSGLSIGDLCNPAMGGTTRGLYNGIAPYGEYGGIFDSGPCQDAPDAFQLAAITAAANTVATAEGSGPVGIVTIGHSRQQQTATGFNELGGSTAYQGAVNSNQGSFACDLGFGSGGSGDCATPAWAPKLNANLQFWPCAVGSKQDGNWVDDSHPDGLSAGLYTGCFNNIISPSGGSDNEVYVVQSGQLSFLHSREAQTAIVNVDSSGMDLTIATGTDFSGWCPNNNGTNYYGQPVTVNGSVSRIETCTDDTHMVLAYPAASCVGGCSSVTLTAANYQNQLGTPNSAAMFEAGMHAIIIRFWHTVWPNVKLGVITNEMPTAGVSYINTEGGPPVAEPIDGYETAWTVQALIADQANQMKTLVTDVTLTKSGTTVTAALNGSSQCYSNASGNWQLANCSTLPSTVVPNGPTYAYTNGASVQVAGAGDATYDTPCTSWQCVGDPISNTSATGFTYTLATAPSTGSTTGDITIVPDPSNAGVGSLEDYDGTAPVLAYGPDLWATETPRVDGMQMLPPDWFSDLLHPSNPIGEGCTGSRTIFSSSTIANSFTTVPGDPWTNCAHTYGGIGLQAWDELNYWTNCTLQNSCSPAWGGPIIGTTLGSGGSGYAVGNTFTVNRGAATAGLAVGVVNSVNSGAVTAFTIVATGDSYSTSTSAVATTATSGSGSGLTLNITQVGSYGYGPIPWGPTILCAAGHQNPGCQ